LVHKLDISVLELGHLGLVTNFTNDQDSPFAEAAIEKILEFAVFDIHGKLIEFVRESLENIFKLSLGVI